MLDNGLEAHPCYWLTTWREMLVGLRRKGKDNLMKGVAKLKICQEMTCSNEKTRGVTLGVARVKVDQVRVNGKGEMPRKGQCERQWEGTNGVSVVV
uniref:Uncharacterized protein n=1 Tax=Lactuca sativa TaxID=4236 RepID=A0A9R1UHG3_LACSA|nr:hypothetical protein LSAT_V11C900490430 [Lactuca sativa]